jgi:hypothetical protein
LFALQIDVSTQLRVNNLTNTEQPRKYITRDYDQENDHHHDSDDFKSPDEPVRSKATSIYLVTDVSRLMVHTLAGRLGNSCLSALKENLPFIFKIDVSDPQSASPAEERFSIVVRIAPEDVFFALNALMPHSVVSTLAEGLAQHIASLTVEKDFPNGLELSLSAKQIDEIPVEVENRIPSFCVNGNDAWLVRLRNHKVQILKESAL